MRTGFKKLLSKLPVWIPACIGEVIGAKKLVDGCELLDFGLGFHGNLPPRLKTFSKGDSEFCRIFIGENLLFFGISLAASLGIVCFFSSLMSFFVPPSYSIC